MRLPVNAPILVGRGEYNHLVIEDTRLSRQHSRVALERGQCVVYDLNSANGTFVNGVAVKRHALSPNDLISFGPCAFRLVYEPGAIPFSEDTEEPTLSGRDSAPGSGGVSQMDNVHTLYSFMQSITKTTDRHELLHLVGSKVLEVYAAATYVGIHLRTEEGEDRDVLDLAYRAGVAAPAAWTALPAEVRRAVFHGGKASLSPDSADMYAPLVDRGDVLGVIHVSAGERAGSFSRGDLDALNGMAAPAAIVLHNSRLHEESLRQVRLRHDLALAAEIQKSFLPREVIAVEGIDLFAEYRAAYTVGGDFYDVFWVAPDRLAVFVGDISGKGISAALLMARISSELRVAALAHIDPVVVLTTMNDATLARGQPELFFTAVYFTLDVKTGEVVLANAGHPTPYSRRATGVVEPITGGRACAVGILDDPGFTAIRLRLEHGDSLVLYTDGIVEAASAEGTFYGQDRLEACLESAGPCPPSVLADRILGSVDAHTERGPVNDDLTLFICQRSVGAAPSMQPRRRSSRFPAPELPKQ